MAPPKIPRKPCEHCGQPTLNPRYCSRACGVTARIKTPAERFWPKVEKTDGCWLWRASLDHAGYGWFGFDGRAIHAQRAAWILTYGPIPDGLFVLHRCDNPPCVRPDHLFLGTQTDNANDMDQKGRRRYGTSKGRRNGAHTHPETHIRGERCWRAKLTADDVRYIRAQRSVGVSGTSLARAFNVTKTTISEIALRRSWKHIE